MEFGMLWLDDHKKRPLEEKIKLAAQYYRGKYGRKPDTCFVNQKTITNNKKVGKIIVIPDKTVLPHHFLIGQKVVEM